MQEGRVQGLHDDFYTLRLLRRIRSEKDLSKVYFPEFRSNLELAIERKDPAELYVIRYEREDPEAEIGRDVGLLLWFPKLRRGGFITYDDWKEGYESADWTDAQNELDALERWVWGEMLDTPGSSE